MALSPMLGSLFGGATGMGLAKNLSMSKAGEAGQAAIQGANFQSEMEITAAELNKIDKDKKSKLSQLDGEERKNRMSVNEKNASTIQF